MATVPRQYRTDDLPPPQGDRLPLSPGSEGPVSMAVDATGRPTIAVPVAAALARQGGRGREVVSVQHRGAADDDFDGPLREARAAGARWARGRSLAATRSVAAALLGRIERGDIGLVCMATHGRGVLGRTVPGNVTAAVVRRSPVPVLLVGPAVRHVGLSVRRLLVCLDGSPPSERALPVATGLAQRMAAGLVLLRVVPDRRAPAGMPELTYLQDVADRIPEPVPLVDVVVAKDATTAIADYAGDRGDTIVVLGSHRRGAVRDLLQGNAAAGIARRAGCPVLVVPAG
jgi:nucleotide-binding universal stress UspA family protein